MLNCEVLVVLALPDNVKVEERAEHWAVQKLISCVKAMRYKLMPTSLSFHEFFKHLHHCEVNFLTVEQVPEQRMHEKLVQSILKLSLDLQKCRIVRIKYLGESVIFTFSRFDQFCH